MRQPIEIMTRVMDNLSESSKNSFCVVSDRLSEGNRAIISTYSYPTKVCTYILIFWKADVIEDQTSLWSTKWHYVASARASCGKIIIYQQNMGYYILASKSNSFHKKLYLLLNILGWIIKKPQKVNRKKPFFSASYFAFTIFWFSHRYNTRDRKSSSGNARDRFLWLQLTFTEMTPVVPDCRWLKSDHGKESQFCFLELLLAQLSNIMIFLGFFAYKRVEIHP